jgi:serine phosphatase RsbU (regulator of sigma subunit)
LDNAGNQLEAEGIQKLLSKEKTLTSIFSKIKTKIKGLEDQSGIEDDITFLAAEFLP